MTFKEDTVSVVHNVRETISKNRQKACHFFTTATFNSFDIFSNALFASKTKKQTQQECESKIIAATLMFVDIKDFTLFAAKHSPSQVVQQLNMLFAEISPVIQNNRGTIDKYMGDEVMAYFCSSDPWQYAQTAQMAVCASIEIQRIITRLNQSWQKQGWPALECGIGLHTGPVIQAPVGYQEKSELTVIGDTVNLAARLQKLTRRFKVPILMSERTQQLVEDYYTDFESGFRDLGFHTVRGQKQRVKLFALNRV